MVFEKKQLSKALAIALMVACAVAFMPLLNGQAFAAAKKPKKAKITSFVQSDTMTTEGYTVTGKWKAAKNAKKYKVIIKEDGTAVLTKTVSKKTKSISYAKAQPGKKYTLSVQSLNGKKKAKAATKNLNVVEKRAALSKVTLKSDNGTISPDAVLTATVVPAEAAADVTYQWYTVSATGLEMPIASATSSTYKITTDTVGSYIKVVAAANASSVSYVGSVDEMTTVPVQANADVEATAVKADPDAVAVVGAPSIVKTTIPAGATATFKWYLNGTTRIDGASATAYTPVADDAGSTLTCIVSIKDADGNELIGKTASQAGAPVTINFGTIYKDASASYKMTLKKDDTEVTKISAGQTVNVSVVKNDKDAAVQSDGVAVTAEWTYPELDRYGNPTGKTIEVKEELTGVNGVFAFNSGSFPTSYGQTVTFTATLKNDTDNEYATYTGTVEIGPDTPTSVALQGISTDTTGNIGQTLTAVVTGTTGAAMDPAEVEIAWKAADDDAVITIKPAAKNQATYVLQKSDIGKKVYATVTTADGTQATAKVAVQKAVLNAARVSSKTDEVADLQVGKDFNVLLGIEGLADQVARPFTINEAVEAADMNVTYKTAAANLGPTAADWADVEGTETAPAIVAGQWYEVEVKLTAEGKKSFVIQDGTTEPLVAVGEAKAADKPAPTVTLQLQDKTDATKYTDITEDTVIQTGDHVKVSTSLMAGTKPAFKGYYNNTANEMVGYAQEAGVADTYEFTVPDGAVGKQIFFVVKAAGYEDATSIKTAKVIVAQQDNTVTLKGAATVGATLTASSPAISDSSAANLSITWKAGSDVITAAQNKASYELTSAEYGKIIYVTVTADNYKEGTARTADVVAKGVCEASAVVPDANMVIGGEVGVEVNPADGAKSYKWYRLSAGGTYTSVTGEGASYTLSADDMVVGSKIVCVVTPADPYDIVNDEIQVVAYNGDATTTEADATWTAVQAEAIQVDVDLVKGSFGPDDTPAIIVTTADSRHLDVTALAVDSVNWQRYNNEWKAMNGDTFAVATSSTGYHAAQRVRAVVTLNAGYKDGSASTVTTSEYNASGDLDRNTARWTYGVN